MAKYCATLSEISGIVVEALFRDLMLNCFNTELQKFLEKTMEGEAVQKSEFAENDTASLSSNATMNTSPEMLKMSEGQEFVHNHICDNAAPTESNNCEVPSNDVVMNEEGMTTFESVTSPDVFVAEVNGSGTEAEALEPAGVETETKEPVEDGVEDMINLEEQAPSKDKSVISPDSILAEANENGTDVEAFEAIKEVEVQDQVKDEVEDDINVEEKFHFKEEAATSPDSVLAESNDNGTEVKASEEAVKGVDEMADDRNAEEKFPPKEESVTSPGSMFAESNGIDTEVDTSEAVKFVVESEIQDQVKDGVADDIIAEEKIPSNGSGTELEALEVIKGVETESQDQMQDDINAEKKSSSKEDCTTVQDDFSVEVNGSVAASETVRDETEFIPDQEQVGVTDDISADEVIPSKEDTTLPAEDNGITPTVQEVSAPDTHLENHSALEGDAAAEAAADDVFENSPQQPTEAFRQDVIKRDEDDLEMKTAEAGQSQQTVSGDVSQCLESLHPEYQSLEVQKAEDANHHDGTEESTSAPEVSHEEQKHEEQEQPAKKTYDENFTVSNLFSLYIQCIII